MIGWILWFFLAPLWFLADGALLGWSPVRLDLSVALCLVIGLFVRTSAVPGLLLCTALGRALLQEGDVALHYLAMGLPIAVLLPVRAAFFERSVLVQSAGAVFLALTVPRVTTFFAELSQQPIDPLPVGFGGVLIAAVSAPLIAAGLRRLPPLSLFVERRP